MLSEGFFKFNFDVFKFGDEKSAASFCIRKDRGYVIKVRFKNCGINFILVAEGIGLREGIKEVKLLEL